MVHTFLEERKGPLGIAYVGAYDEKRIPEYPAVVVVPNGRGKEIHATNTFQIFIVLHLYVYHGNLTLTKRERSKQDLLLVSSIEAELEKDYEWRTDPNDPLSKRVIFAYISEEEPGALQPRTSKSQLIIGTRLTWRALVQRRFNES